MFSLTTSDCCAGQKALEQGAWAEARAAFEQALLSHESPEALEGLGVAAWWLDLADLVFDSRERAYRLYMSRDDRTSAARIAVWLGWDYWAFRGESVVANGWLQRARRLLEGYTACPERAWLEVREAVFSLKEGNDPKRAQALAVEAIRIACEVGDVDLEMIGRAVQGLSLVVSGAVGEGMRNLDEVNAAVIAGELTDRIGIGLSGCYMVSACELVRDHDRATQWCTRLKEFCNKSGLRPLLAVCRTQYASICLWRGTWFEAEQELTAARDEFSASRPAMVNDAIVRLAELRRRQGRLTESVALYDQVQPHADGLLGRAEVAFDLGEKRAAAEQAERCLRKLSEQNLIDRALGLELLVRALTDLNEGERAKGALAELCSVAKTIATVPLMAAAAFASGYVSAAEGKLDDARRYFEDAIDLFLRSGAPFEVGRTRTELARVLKSLGRIDAAMEEAREGLAVLSELTADLEAERARSVLESLATVKQTDYPPTAAAAGKSDGLTKREIEILRLVADGLNSHTIAERLIVSDHTVHRHLANILNKLNVSTRAAAVAQAVRSGILR
jgi:LuxR family transcriptional regulator, maltose regulon positive regulatory protein